MYKLSLCLVALVLMASCSVSPQPDIVYAISSVENDETPQLKILLNFPAEPDGTTSLSFQNKAWGQDSLHNVISSIKVRNAEAEISKNDDKGFTIAHSPDLEMLEVEYTLQQDREGVLTTKNDFRPIIEDTYFHIYAHNLFMLPEYLVTEENEPFSVVLEWEGFSEDMAVINSFGSNQRRQFIENTTEQDFHNAIFVGGDYRENSFEVSGNQVVLAIRGDWKVFTDEEMTSILEKTILAQRSFWQDHSQPYFLVTMTPTFEEQGSSFHGTGLTNSFALTASNNDNLEVTGLTYLINHELQHNWTGKMIQNENEEEQYWFSEGFTEYYTYKNIARYEIYGLDKSYFLEEFNQLIANLYTSPVCKAPNSAINYENFWSDFEYSKLPYRRGALFAFFLDHKIQQDSEGTLSLDDVMLKIKEDALSEGQKLTHTYFIKTVNDFLEEDIEPFFYKHIIDGDLIDLVHWYETFGYDFQSFSEVFDLGFEFSEDRKTVKAIDESSPAYLAGLRVGDRVGSYGYMPGNLDIPVEMNVLRKGKELTIQYYPKGEKAIPQLSPNQKNLNNLSW
ncbi:MAG: M1 family aminopeptidase [Bacteroidota bacterium]